MDFEVEHENLNVGIPEIDNIAKDFVSESLDLYADYIVQQFREECIVEIDFRELHRLLIENAKIEFDLSFEINEKFVNVIEKFGLSAEFVNGVLEVTIKESLDSKINI